MAQKVAELLDSFKPGGTYSYRPFYKGFKVYRNLPDDHNNNNNNSNTNSTNNSNQNDLDHNNNNNNNNHSTTTNNNNNINNNNNNINNNNNNQNDLENNNNVSENLAQNVDNIAVAEPGNGTNPRFTASESARRRLYLDLDRPRPFYGRSDPHNRPEATSTDANDFYLVQDYVGHSDPRSLQVS